MGPFGEKEVQFFKYCERCEYFKTKETDDPCNECLSVPMRQFTAKPINFVDSNKKKR